MSAADYFWATWCLLMAMIALAFVVMVWVVVSPWIAVPLGLGFAALFISGVAASRTNP